MTDLVQASILAFVLSVILVRLFAKGPLARRVLDRPNERSLHETPVPRTGGLGLFIAAGISWLFFADGALLAIVVLAGLLMAPSIADDIMHLPVITRFAVQIAVALALLVTLSVPWFLFPLLLLATLWMTNLYNFMDGSNGLAGGMTVIGFGGYAMASWFAGAHDIALTAAIAAAAAAGFLVWNFRPAIVFLGDAGSIPLGFLAAAIGIAGWRRGIWPLPFPALLFAPFIVDATLTLARRLLRGDKVLKAHREHTYQKLIRSGWSHARTALAAYLIMGVFVVLALSIREASEVAAFGLAGLCLAGLVLMFLLIDRRIAGTAREAG